MRVAPLWFTDVEDVAYSLVEYIPLVGTVYSLERAGVAYGERDWKNHWQSVANFLESSIRDVVLFAELAEPVEVALLHTMAESFTDKMIDIYAKQKLQINSSATLDRQSGHVLIAENSKGKLKSKVFDGQAKGVHLFHGAEFVGKIQDDKYAPNGEEIHLQIPHGLYNGARVTFSWRWTRDYWGTPGSPEALLGQIRLEAGTPTRFGLSSRKGAGGWDGYDIWGDILSKDHISATIKVGEKDVHFDLKRVPGT
ncbi:hypothetical protein BDV24DRAFT_170415 [Aspergillus arachidicola]|uniref:Uncharacterized protein n=1 Tax=Aspergillus arachidicola TaxID=656916 RepID=A0A5N6XRM3_9EURO|nr:hypothetical protein BDV24DRAFT_170415 [Aspergillus arachidicola]